MKKIVGVNFSFPSDEEDDYISLDSTSSLSDADIAIFCADISATSYDTSISDPLYAGKTLYDQYSSSMIVDHIDHWRREILQFLKSGKTLILLLAEKNEFYIHTGQKDISGTGRNQKVANLVIPKNNYDFIPFNINVVSANGRAVYATTQLVQDFFSSFQSKIYFEAYIDDEKIKNALFTTKNKDRILGAHLKYEVGNILMFPMINVGGDNSLDEDGYWTPEALVSGKEFKQKIVEIDKKITAKILSSPTPTWVNKRQFNLREAEKTKKLVERKQKKIALLQKEVQDSIDLLKEQEKLKDLLFETGKQLEFAVITALEIIGFKANNFDDGNMELDQVIMSPEGHRYIGECEGKDNKAIDINKFRQLLDLLNEDFEREEVDEKAFGLLFGNPQRLTEPSARKYDFTEKCLRAAKREKIGLIRTADLFKVTKYISENNENDFKVLCRSEIYKQLGGIVKFPDIPTKAN